jgi:predicted enzyme related to lactoylglutathione lyase
MINGGNATIYVSDMDRAVKFFTETLGLKLDYQAGAEWAQIQAGKGLVLGLHGTAHGGTAGKQGSTVVGFDLDEPIENVYETLVSRGVKFDSPPMDTGHVKLANFHDPDGNPFYLSETPHQ